jgi:hypothetical protein
LHEARMARIFYRRMAVEYQKTVVLATAVMRHENADSVVKALNALREMMFPGDDVQRVKREDQMREIMTVEGRKSYKVRRVFRGR